METSKNYNNYQKNNNNNNYYNKKNYSNTNTQNRNSQNNNQQNSNDNNNKEKFKHFPLLINFNIEYDTNLQSGEYTFEIESINVVDKGKFVQVYIIIDINGKKYKVFLSTLPKILVNDEHGAKLRSLLMMLEEIGFIMKWARLKDISGKYMSFQYLPFLYEACNILNEAFSRKSMLFSAKIEHKKKDDIEWNEIVFDGERYFKADLPF